MGERMRQALTRAALTRAACAATVSLMLAAGASAQSPQRPPQDKVFYQIIPIAWRDSDNDIRSGQPARFGDFNGLTASLD